MAEYTRNHPEADVGVHLTLTSEWNHYRWGPHSTRDPASGLLDNALKYTEPEGQVEVRATDDGSYAVVEVADTGPGIPEEDLPHIFEELYRGQQAKRVEGSGLGLTLVHKIITLQGGEIDVRSREAHGTVMSVRLPLATDLPQLSTSTEN